jgi:lysophospholipid acyltransferase (LPLAT)-like uncharacterized protein
MFLPLPFSRIKVYVLTPRHVAPDENEEEVTQALRADMLRYHGASDRAG